MRTIRAGARSPSAVGRWVSRRDKVGEACDGAEAVALAGELEPDVVVMDIRMPGVDGIEATRRITARRSNSHVLILTTFGLDEHVYAALSAGASGFMLKNVPPQRLVEAIRTVAEGDALLAPSITRRLIEEHIRRPPADGPRPERLEPLSRSGRYFCRPLNGRRLTSGRNDVACGERAVNSEAPVRVHGR